MINSSNFEHLFSYECHSGSLDDNLFLLSIKSQDNGFEIYPLENQHSSEIFERNVWHLKNNQDMINSSMNHSISTEKTKNASSDDQVNSKEKLKKLKVKSDKSKKKSSFKLCKFFHKNTSKSSNHLNVPISAKTSVDSPKTFSSNDSIDKDKFNNDQLILGKVITEIIGNQKTTFELVQKTPIIVIETKSKTPNESQTSSKRSSNILKEMDSNKIFQKTTSKSLEISSTRSDKRRSYFPKTQSDMDTTEESQFNLDRQRIDLEIQEVLKHLKNLKPLPTAEVNCSDAFDCGSNG